MPLTVTSVSKCFQKQVKKVTKNITAEIKTIETFLRGFSITVLLMRFQAFVIKVVCFMSLQISSISVLSLKKQMNWALKCVVRSSIKSNELRKRKNTIALRQLIELKILMYYFQYNRNMKTAFPQQPNDSYGEL